MLVISLLGAWVIIWDSITNVVVVNWPWLLEWLGWLRSSCLCHFTIMAFVFFLFLILHIGRDIFGGFAGHEWYFDASKGHTRNFSFSLDLNFVFCYCSTPTEVQEKILKGGWIRILCLDIYVLLMMLVFGQVNFSSWVVVFFLFLF